MTYWKQQRIKEQREKTYNFLQALIIYILGAVALILAIDFLAFLWWGISGQTPISDFYIGGITRMLIK